MTETKLYWSELDRRAVDTVRVLAMDAVEKAGNGHPGTAMSLAPAAYLLFQRVMRHDPTDPAWPGRDRFVLSCGHSSLTLYIQLYLAGYGLELDDLKQLRTVGLAHPRPPRARPHDRRRDDHRPARPGLRQRGRHGDGGPPRARPVRPGCRRPGTARSTTTIYVLASDGDMEEGISHEAASLAAHQKLGNLLLIWDDNSISIEDDTNIAKSEDMPARFAAYGWHVQHVDWRTRPRATRKIPRPCTRRSWTAQKVTDRPSFIALRTIIGWPAPTKQNTGKIHGSALGADEVAATKKILGFDPRSDVPGRPGGARPHPRGRQARSRRARGLADRLRRLAGREPEAGRAVRPHGDAHTAGRLDRRAARASRPTPRAWPPVRRPARCCRRWRPCCPSYGAARPTWPRATTPRWRASRRSSRRSTRPRRSPATGTAGRCTSASASTEWARFSTGSCCTAALAPYGGTFLVFSDYMRPAVRLAALMKLPVVYVWTHDSIGLGEDGPTHQPIEHLSALRAIPGLDVVRPGDANETAWAWRMALEHTDRPTALVPDPAEPAGPGPGRVRGRRRRRPGGVHVGRVVYAAAHR